MSALLQDPLPDSPIQAFGFEQQPVHVQRDAEDWASERGSIAHKPAWAKDWFAE
jgi:hypothetical protein